MTFDDQINCVKIILNLDENQVEELKAKAIENAQKSIYTSTEIARQFHARALSGYSFKEIMESNSDL